MILQSLDHQPVGHGKRPLRPSWSGYTKSRPVKFRSAPTRAYPSRQTPSERLNGGHPNSDFMQRLASARAAFEGVGDW